MRALVFLLVLANLLFFAWAQGYFGTPAAPDAGRLAQQLNPERLRVVARGEPPPKVTPAAAPAAAVPAPPAEACLVWSGLIAAEADQLAKVVGERGPSAKLTRKPEATTATAWWVFIPPLATKADVERKAGELRKRDVSDFFVVQEAGPNRLAISLGVFSTEAGARAYLETLRGKDVRSAKLAPKSGAEQHLAVEVRGPEAELSGLRNALGERTAGECPAPAPGPAPTNSPAKP